MRTVTCNELTYISQSHGQKLHCREPTNAIYRMFPQIKITDKVGIKSLYIT